MLTKPYKGASINHISQEFHAGHQALDIVPRGVFAFGMPVTAPEEVKITRIFGDVLEADRPYKDGFGVYMTGLETGNKYIYWHFLRILPVWGGDVIKRGQIIGWCGNSGLVYSKGEYVPLADRLSPSKPGTHIHIEIKDRHGLKQNPRHLFNWLADPSYTSFDFIGAVGRTVSKMAKLTVRWNILARNVIKQSGKCISWIRISCVWIAGLNLPSR